MKLKLTTILTIISIASFAQVNDTVYTNGGANEVYYHLATGKEVQSSLNEWDFAFTNILVDASILSNDIAGVEVYLASENIADWETLDTTGMNWKRIYNSETTWMMGSFANLGGVHPDYGWGQYNQSTHNVMAKRLFVVKLRNGAIKKMIIDKMETTGNVTFRLADLNGTNLVSKTYSKNDYKAYNFVHYDAVKDSFIAHEAESVNWDMLFTKYPSEVSPGTFYPVSGVKVNKDVKVAQRDAIMVESDDTTGLNYGTNISEIGSDWKSYSMSLNKYEMVADRAYFLKLKNNEVWKIIFTGYESNPIGSFHFSKELIAGSASAASINAENNFVVYPNPASEKITILVDGANYSQGWVVSIKDFTGKELKKVVGENTQFSQIDLSTNNLVSGAYLLELSVEGQMFRKKINILK